MQGFSNFLGLFQLIMVNPVFGMVAMALRQMLVPQIDLFLFTSMFEAQSGSKNLNFSGNHVPLVHILVMIFRALRSMGNVSQQCNGLLEKMYQFQGYGGAPYF